MAATDKAALEGHAALDDDLNTPVALAALGEIAKQANELCDLAHKRRKDPALTTAAAVAAARVEASLVTLAGVLGLLGSSPTEYFARTRERRLRLRGLGAPAIDALVAARTEARQSKDFARSDQLRAELAEKGVLLADGPEGTTWTVCQ
jgi:cysteinyl-tRNA synthetase